MEFRSVRHGLRIVFAVMAAFVLTSCGGGGGGSGSSNGGGASGLVAPIIVAQPQSQSVNDGQSATFSVAATGSTPLTYQWLRAGSPIAGATAASYSLPAVQLSDNGAVFAVVISNAAGSVTSANATLTVAAVAPSIANNVPMSVSVVAGQPATFRVTASGSAPLTFQWRRNGVAIAGATSSTYMIAATTLADNGASFDVVVSNSAGSVTSALFTLTVSAAPIAPSIASQPQSQTVRAGNAATFTVMATGTAPFTYQWFRNGVAIAGAQASSYTLTTQSSDNGAQFSVAVSNSAGSTTSGSATLTVVSQGTSAVLSGNIGGPGNINGLGTAARFSAPSGPAVDAAGNVYVGDTSTVRKFAANGTVTTLAGSPTVSGSMDGSGSAASFADVAAVAVDASGNLYVADDSNHTIRHVTAAGVVTTFAGTAGQAGSADGTGASARFNQPGGIAVDAAGNVYVADTGNQTIRRITPAGVVTTLAGSPGVIGSADGSGAAASFNLPSALAVDGSGNLYVADRGNDTIRKVTPAGFVTTVAGTAGAVGSADGTGAAARFNGPTGIAVDAAGNLYVGDGANATLRKITPAGIVTTIAGSAGVVGSADGTGAAASFSTVTGVTVDSGGRLYVADRNNYALRAVSTTDVVTTIAGAPAVAGAADGTGSAATFRQPYGLALSPSGLLYVADVGSFTIRVVSASGVTSTLAGSPGLTGSADGQGSAARFGSMRGLAVNASGTIYVADFSNDTIRQITPSGLVSTLAGNPGVAGSSDGTGAAATFNGPTDIAIDAAGNLYVTDGTNSTVRRVTPAGVVTTFAGTAGHAGSNDGTGTGASFNLPRGIVIDQAGNLYVVDGGNETIRRITSAGVVTTIAGAVGQIGSADGAGANARFQTPNGLGIDNSGNLFVADTGNRTIRRIDTSDNVTTVVGVADGLKGVALGTLPGHLDQPLQVIVSANGGLLITDSNGVLQVTAP